MSEVVTEAFYPHLSRCGRVRCTNCGAVFDFGPYDVRDVPNIWGSERYLYLECPNEDCRKRAILKDFRLFGPLWRRLDEIPMVALVSTDES